MKKTTALLLIAVSAAFLTACGSGKEPTAVVPTSVPTTEAPKATEAPENNSGKEDNNKNDTVTPEVKEQGDTVKEPETTGEKVTPKPTEAPAATPTTVPTSTPTEAPVTTPVADVENNENNWVSDTYWLTNANQGATSFVTVSLNKLGNECSVALPLSSNSEDNKNGTYVVQDNKLTLHLDGCGDIYFEIKDDSLVFDLESTGKSEITDKITLENGATFVNMQKMAEWDVTGDVAKEDMELIVEALWRQKSQVIRTNGYVDGAAYPRTVIITSRAELDEYYVANSATYDLGNIGGDAGCFIRVCEQYDDAFFAENNLLLVLLESGTGSARYSVKNLKRSGNTANVNINVTVPEFGTCDMAEWHVIIPVKKAEVNADTEIKVEISAASDKGNITKEDDNKMNVNMTEVTETKAPGTATMKAAGVGYGKVTHFTYESKTTGLTRGANILLPADYDTSKEYPVLYFLHGIFGDENSLPGDTNNRIAEITANLRAQGYIEDIIVVFPNMFAKTDPNAAPAFSAAGVWPYDNFINDLANDLIPYVEANYSVKKDREHRGLIGFSMGGRETLYIGTRRSDLFSTIGCIAPAPGVTPGKDGFMTHEGQLSEDELVVVQQDTYPLDMLLICCGTVDGVVGKFPESYHNIMTKNGVEHLWYEVPGANHDNEAIKSGYYNYLIRWGSLMSK